MNVKIVWHDHYNVILWYYDYAKKMLNHFCKGIVLLMEPYFSFMKMIKYTIIKIWQFLIKWYNVSTTWVFKHQFAVGSCGDQRNSSITDILHSYRLQFLLI